MTPARITIRLLPLLAVAFAAPALAQDAPQSVDLVATVIGGFADGATVAVAPDPMVVARTAPGVYSGTTEAGLGAALAVVESAPCVFDITFTMGPDSFPVRLDVGLVEAIAFEPGGSMGLPEPMKPYGVKLTGPEGLATRPNPDGTSEPLSGSPTIATSVPVADLEAAAAALKQLCPTR